MSEHAFKTMSRVGGANIALGIIMMIAGLACGVITIIGGAKLLKGKHELTF